jgi:hypothetical protein
MYFGVTVDLVIDRIPVDGRSITATSQKVSFASIERSLSVAHGRITDALQSNGIKEPLPVSTTLTAQQAVIAFAVYEAMDSLGFSEKAREAKAHFDELFEEFRSRPQGLGSAFKPRSQPAPQPFDGKWNFHGFDFKF